MKNEPQRKPQCFMLPRRRNIHTAVNTNSHVPFVLSCLHHRIHLKRLLSLLCTLINHNSYIIWETQQPHGFPRGKEKDVSVNMCLVHKGGESWNHIENDSNDSEELLCIAWHFPSPLAAPQSVPATTQHLWMLMHTRTHTHNKFSILATHHKCQRYTKGAFGNVSLCFGNNIFCLYSAAPCEI